jgi:hypothetical protein
MIYRMNKIRSGAAVAFALLWGIRSGRCGPGWTKFLPASRIRQNRPEKLDLAKAGERKVGAVFRSAKRPGGSEDGIGSKCEREG